MSKFKEEISSKNENSQDRYVPMKSSVDEVQIIKNKNLVSAKIIYSNKVQIQIKLLTVNYLTFNWPSIQKLCSYFG